MDPRVRAICDELRAMEAKRVAAPPPPWPCPHEVCFIDKRDGAFVCRQCYHQLGTIPQTDT